MGSPRYKNRAIIQEIPIEFFLKFKDDPVKSALEYMSITRGSRNPFIRDLNKVYEAIARGADRSNPINEETYGFDSSFVAKDRFPRYIHIDLSINRDAVGIAMCHSPYFVESIVTFPGEAEPRLARVPFVKFDFVGRLKQRPDMGERELNYRAIAAMVMSLEEERKFNLREGLITFDRFQSHMMMQLFREIGFTTALLSVDHTQSAIIVNYAKPDNIERVPMRGQPAAACMSFKEALYQDRMDFPANMGTHDGRETWIEKEAREATWIPATQKVVKMDGGTDDVWQSICGATFNCMNNAPDWGDVTLANKRSKQELALEAREEDFYSGLGRGMRQDGDVDIVSGSGDFEDDFYSRVNQARGYV